MPSQPTTGGEPALEQMLATELLDIGAVSFSPDEPYTWASGIRSPVYCDNRLTISYPAVRRLITDGFARILAESNYHPDVIAGTATAGIPHAAWLADRLERPLVYVRSAAKGHGRGRQVEGLLEPGRKVVLIEDLVSTGMSSLQAVNALIEEGANVQAVLAIFSYGLDAAARAFAEARIPLHALTSFHTVLQTAQEQGRVDSHASESIAEWQQDPGGWKGGSAGE